MSELPYSVLVVLVGSLIDLTVLNQRLLVIDLQSYGDVQCGCSREKAQRSGIHQRAI